jgi:hypothetical protein
MTSVTPKASAKHDLFLNKPASSKHLRQASDLTSTTRQIGSKIIKVIVKILGNNFFVILGSDVDVLPISDEAESFNLSLAIYSKPIPGRLPSPLST